MDAQLIALAGTAIRRGRDWLERHEADIRRMEDLSAHYKAPYLYAALGDPLRARAYADRLTGRYLQADGDFRTAADAKGWAHLPCSPANRYVYANGWIIVGLRRSGLLGPTRRALDFVMRFQDAELGGFRSRFDLAAGRPEPGHLDTSSTASAGMALLACGRVADAVRAGDFVLRVIAAQPEPAQRFYASWLAGTGLHTDVAGSEDQNALRGRKQFCLDARTDPRRELTWLIGKPMKFLAMLHDQTGDRRYLDGAVALFDFFHRLDDNRWRNYASCKIMWGAATLFRLTGERRFAETAERLLEWICRTQQPEGVWLHTLWYDRLEDQPFPAGLDIVQEFGGEISDVLFDLAPGG